MYISRYVSKEKSATTYIATRMKYITKASIHDNHGSTEVFFGSGLEGITEGIEDDGNERNLTHSGKFRLESRYQSYITTFSHCLAKK